ncbi:MULTISPECIES: hypothetical protein [unclassified Myxococcus]|uniref:hypothetical protein n=1 Tax=Myxococcus TaxID=32 RepID=UPI001CBE7A10|nr:MULTISPECIES: hypothetical protein [unclassified Myxococcus]MBZ4401115.1 hypothetical protein [Myxococcus sp. AS-1-15]MBZ4410921.1 hypothetical protein [Myxococcus sp. XM-1-1-1]
MTRGDAHLGGGDGGIAGDTGQGKGHPAEGTALLSQGVIIVSRESVRITLLPASLPPSTTKASFDRFKTEDSGFNGADAGIVRPLDEDYAGDHIEVVWDPSINSPLAKSVVLGVGTWQLSFFAHALQHPSIPFADTSWSQFGFVNYKDRLVREGQKELFACAFRKTGNTQKMPLMRSGQNDTCPAAAAGDDLAAGWSSIPIYIMAGPLLSPQQLLKNFGQRGEVAVPLPSSGRSFEDSAISATSELFQAVADVALERVEIAALEAIREQILAKLCDASLEDLVDQAFQGVKWEARGSPQPVLHRTCEALKRVRLQELATASAGLQVALKQDIADFAATLLALPLKQGMYGMRQGTETHALIARDPNQGLAAIVGGLALLVKFSLEPESTGSSIAAAQLVVRQFVESIREDSLHRLQEVGGVPDSLIIRGGLVVAATVIAACHVEGDCDSHLVRRHIEHPELFMSLKSHPLLKNLGNDPRYVALQGRLTSIVAHGIAVMSPRSQQDSRRTAIEAAAMSFETLELLVEAGNDTPEVRLQRKRELRAYREMSEAMLKQNFTLALVSAAGIAAVKLTGDPAEKFDRKMRYASAFANYLQSYPSLNALGSPGVELSLEEQRRLRRQSINTFVDLASDRTQQVGDVAVALTVTPGIRAFRWASTRVNDFPAGTHLALPLGVNVEFGLSDHVGLGGNVSVFDLGQYASLNVSDRAAQAVKPEPMTAFAPGLGISASYRNWNLILDARYAPQWKFNEEASRRNVSFGLSLGYRVPLLQLH